MNSLHVRIKYDCLSIYIYDKFNHMLYTSAYEMYFQQWKSNTALNNCISCDQLSHFDI